MSEHWIRLRGGWELEDLGAAEVACRRISLPADQAFDAKGQVRLRRRFGRPPLEAGNQQIWLRLDRVPGLTSIRLNGRERTGEPAVPGPIEIPLEPLPPRNELELVADCSVVPEGGWGEVAIVIRGRAERECDPWPGTTNSLG